MDTGALKNSPASSRDDVLVDTGWLAAHLHDPAVRIVEVDVSRAGYDDWHIDGAVLWNVYADLKDGDYRLAADSTLIGAYPQSAGELLSVDLAGDAYPFAGFADIGAYEDTVFKDGFEGE